MSSERNKRNRKSKGAFSVMDEFAADSPGEIVFSPRLEPDQVKAIELKTKMADAPVSSKAQLKVESNLGQSEAKVEPREGLTEVKIEPNLSQKLEPEKRVDQEVEPQPEPRVEPNLSQSKAKVEPVASIEALVGLQRRCLFFIYESCRSSGSKVSAPISVEVLAQSSKSTTAAVRKAVQRLEQKHVIYRAKYKDGRGGWTQYGLSDSIYNSLLMNETRAKLEPKLSQTPAKVEPELEPELEPSSSSSSSNVLLKRSTATNTDASEKWRGIQTPDSLKAQGFGLRQIKALVEANQLSMDEIQSSISHFAHDLEQGSLKIKTTALNFFMGVVLKRGMPYVSDSALKAEQEEIEHYLKQVEELKKAKDSLAQVRFDSDFQTWIASLTSEERQQITGGAKFMKENGPAELAALREHFRKNRECD